MILKKLNKQLKVLLFSSFTVFLVITILAVIPTSYDLTVPSQVSNIDEVYDFENVENNNVNVNSVAVYSYYKISVLNYLQAKLNPFAVIEKHDDYTNTSVEYGYTSGTIQKNVSLTNSLIVGYTYANKQIGKEFLGYIVHSIFGKGESLFKLGDIIVKCEGISLTENLTVSKVLADKYGVITGDDGLSYVNITLDTIYNFTVLRDNKEVEVNTKAFPYIDGDEITPTLGINYYGYYRLLNDDTHPKYEINNPNTYGPSAGLMQALFIYDYLSFSNLTKGIKVVGTGTIDAFGNAGAIGGVKAKVMAANLSKADIFFVPDANYEEALEQYQKIKTKMKLVKVSNLQEVIDYLNNYQKGGN